MKTGVLVFLTGVLFALGLGLSGMTPPAKVIGFLDVAGAWDPSLAFVMAGALATHGLSRLFIVRRGAPLLARTFQVNPNRQIDGRLLGGAALFGIGWGLSGYCPGPAFVSLGSGAGEPVLFVGAMALGMAVVNLRLPRARPNVVAASTAATIAEPSEASPLATAGSTTAAAAANSAAAPSPTPAASAPAAAIDDACG